MGLICMEKSKEIAMEVRGNSWTAVLVPKKLKERIIEAVLTLFVIVTLIFVGLFAALVVGLGMIKQVFFPNR